MQAFAFASYNKTPVWFVPFCKAGRQILTEAL